MTPAQDFLIRALVISAMIGGVLVLMRLTGGEVASQIQKTAHATDATHVARAPKTRAERIAAMADNWSGSIVFGDAYAALTPLTTTQDGEESARFNPDDDYWGLPRSEGVETVAGLCGACHSLAIVMQQRQTEDGWNYLFDWMIEKQGMAEPAREMRVEIIAYLSREFASE